jgi:hypothetical protein
MIAAFIFATLVIVLFIYARRRRANTEARLLSLGRLNTRDVNLIDLCAEDGGQYSPSVAELAYLKLTAGGTGPRWLVGDSIRYLSLTRALLADATQPLPKDVVDSRSQIEHEFTDACILFLPAQLELAVGRFLPMHYSYGRRLLYDYVRVVALTDRLCEILRPDLCIEMERLN